MECQGKTSRRRREFPEIIMDSMVEEEEAKMVLVVNSSLAMGKGKVSAQCGHAAVLCYKAAMVEVPVVLARWERIGMAKVVVKAREEELEVLVGRARKAGVLVVEVRDAGRTQVDNDHLHYHHQVHDHHHPQVAAGSLTVVGLGPGPATQLDQVSSGLKLY